MSERRQSGGVATDTTFNGGGGDIKSTSMKVPRQCPLVPMVKVRKVMVRRLEVEKVKR
jgi:hypothetical protein